MSHIKSSALLGVNVPRSRSYQGAFGRMFPKLKPWQPKNSSISIEKYLTQFANKEMSENDPENESLNNTNLPAGYTYFGQFVDHDITFDPTSSLQRQNDPNKIHNFRTPKLDLDSLYGQGPNANPYLYDNKKRGMFLIGSVQEVESNGNFSVFTEPDLPRNDQGRALIGDMRNDENLIVSQFHLAMLILHNRTYGKILGHGDLSSMPEEIDLDESAFLEAQRIVRWFYQYIVWNDFIKRLISKELHEQLLDLNGIFSYGGRFFRWKNNPFMPVEFSVAAYRFGHTLIRPGYQVNTRTSAGLGFGVEKPIFNPDGSNLNDLRGSRYMEQEHTIQWDWFFKFPSSSGPFPQPSRNIDTKLSSSVSKIPDGHTKTNPLAFLNLLRSLRMEIPSGSDVARMMGFDPHDIDDEREDILWFYILRESSLLPELQRGQKLGQVGGQIVGEVFAGLLKGDSLSFVNCFPNWNPGLEEALPFSDPLNEIDGWVVADILRAAGMPATSEDVDSFILEGVPGAID